MAVPQVNRVSPTSRHSLGLQCSSVLGRPRSSLGLSSNVSSTKTHSPTVLHNQDWYSPIIASDSYLFFLFIILIRVHLCRCIVFLLTPVLIGNKIHRLRNMTLKSITTSLAHRPIPLINSKLEIYNYY